MCTNAMRTHFRTYDAVMKGHLPPTAVQPLLQVSICLILCFWHALTVQLLHHWILITATSATLDRFGNDCCKRLQICSRSSGLLSFLLLLFTHLPSEVKFRNHVLSINGDRRLLYKSRRGIWAFIINAQRKDLIKSTSSRFTCEIDGSHWDWKMGRYSSQGNVREQTGKVRENHTK